MIAATVTNAGVWFILAALITIAVLLGIGAALVHRHDPRGGAR